MKVEQPLIADRPAYLDHPAPRRDVDKVQTDRKNDEDGAASTGRDFAGVLDKLARADDRARHDDDSTSRDAEHDEERVSDRDSRERAERRRRDERDGSGEGGKGGFERVAPASRGVIATGEAPGARSILHIADLERIAALARAQVSFARGEVTMRLHNSVLEGLRVRLDRDDVGGVRAEFIAASERVRNLVEQRAPELAELLRARGVPLASIKTSVGTDAQSSDAEREDRSPFDSVDLSRSVPHDGDATASSALDAAKDVSPSDVYRA